MKTNQKLCAFIASFLLLGFAAAPAVFADDIPAGYRYVEEKGQTLLELKRVSIFNTDGKLVSKAVHFRDGGVLRESFRADGTLSLRRDVDGNGNVREEIEYDATGVTVNARKSYRANGTLDWEATRKADGHTLRKDYYKSGKLKRQRELFDKNAFSDITYREDGSKWHGSERKVNETGRGTSLYFAPAGKSLTRTHNGATMTVTVSDDKGNELYRQTWLNRVGGYNLSSVKEPVSAGGWRVIHLRGSQVDFVEYYEADGKLARTERGNALTAPVDAARLQELDSKDDPTIPRLIDLR